MSRMHLYFTDKWRSRKYYFICKRKDNKSKPQQVRKTKEKKDAVKL